MTTININRPDNINAEPLETVNEQTTENGTVISKDEIIKKLREQELKLNYLEKKGLINSEVKKTKIELANLIKELEALNVQ